MNYPASVKTEASPRLRGHLDAFTDQSRPGTTDVTPAALLLQICSVSIYSISVFLYSHADVPPPPLVATVPCSGGGFK